MVDTLAAHVGGAEDTAHNHMVAGLWLPRKAKKRPGGTVPFRLPVFFVHTHAQAVTSMFRLHPSLPPDRLMLLPAQPLSEASAPGFPCHDAASAAAGACVAYPYRYDAAARAFVRTPDPRRGRGAADLVQALQEDVPLHRVAARYGLRDEGVLIVPPPPPADDAAGDPDPLGPTLLLLEGSRTDPPPELVPLDLVRLLASAAHLVRPPCAACGRRPRGYVLPNCGHLLLCGHCLLRLPSPRCPACGRTFLPGQMPWPLRAGDLQRFRLDALLAAEPPASPVRSVDAPTHLRGGLEAMRDHVRLEFEHRHGALLAHSFGLYATVETRVLERRLRWEAVVRDPDAADAWPRRDDLHRPCPAFRFVDWMTTVPWSSDEASGYADAIAAAIQDIDPPRYPYESGAEEQQLCAHVQHAAYACARATRWFRYLRWAVRVYHVVTLEALHRECGRAVAWWRQWWRTTRRRARVDWPEVTDRLIRLLAVVALEELRWRLEPLLPDLATTYVTRVAAPAPLEAEWQARRDAAAVVVAGANLDRATMLHLQVNGAVVGEVPGRLVTPDMLHLELDRQIRTERALPREHALVDAHELGEATRRAVVWAFPDPRAPLPWPDLRQAVGDMCSDRGRLFRTSDGRPMPPPAQWSDLVEALGRHAVAWYMDHHQVPADAFTEPVPEGLREALVAVAKQELEGFTS